MKQVTGKNKGTRKKAAKKVVGKKKASKAKGPADFVEVRKEIATLVRGSATKIAMEVIKVALTGQLAQTKYLFEAVGLYPPTAESQTPKIEDSLAFTLLKRMGLPTEPVIFELLRRAGLDIVETMPMFAPPAPPPEPAVAS